MKRNYLINYAITITLLSINTYCHSSTERELICKQKIPLEFGDPYQLVLLKKNPDAICIYWTLNSYTCSPSNASINQEKYYDESNLIKVITTFKNITTDGNIYLTVTDKWVPYAKVERKRSGEHIIFKYKKTSIETLETNLQPVDYKVFEVLTLIKDKYEFEINFGDRSYDTYKKRVIGDNKIYRYSLNRYTKILRTEHPELNQTIDYQCEDVTDKL